MPAMTLIALYCDTGEHFELASKRENSANACARRLPTPHDDDLPAFYIAHRRRRHVISQDAELH